VPVGGNAQPGAGDEDAADVEPVRPREPSQADAEAAADGRERVAASHAVVPAPAGAGAAVGAVVAM
jgi:hypothetical protein